MSKILKTKYTALLQIGELINCSPASLKACSQILLFQQQLQKYVLSPGGKKKEKTRGKKEREGESGIFSFSPRLSESIFRQDSASMLRFFKVKGLQSIKFGEHIMASTPYKGHLWVDDQASLWLSSYHAHLITFWKNSIHHPPTTFRENSATARCLFPVRAECQEQQQ